MNPCSPDLFRIQVLQSWRVTRSRRHEKCNIIKIFAASYLGIIQRKLHCLSESQLLLRTIRIYSNQDPSTWNQALKVTHPRCQNCLELVVRPWFCLLRRAGASTRRLGIERALNWSSGGGVWIWWAELTLVTLKSFISDVKIVSSRILESSTISDWWKDLCLVRVMIVSVPRIYMYS